MICYMFSVDLIRLYLQEEKKQCKMKLWLGKRRWLIEIRDKQKQEIHLELRQER